MLRRFRLPLVLTLLAASCAAWAAAQGATDKPEPRRQHVIVRGLDYLANTQSRLGHWSANDGRYPTAMTALAGMALLQEGSTTTQGKYAPNIRRAVDYLCNHSRSNGLIGDPTRRRSLHLRPRLFDAVSLAGVGRGRRRSAPQGTDQVLTKAVEFCGRAQTDDGGWGYVSAKDGGGFDEGSTTITQVQGLRGCRNAGITGAQGNHRQSDQIHS